MTLFDFLNLNRIQMVQSILSL